MRSPMRPPRVHRDAAESREVPENKSKLQMLQASFKMQMLQDGEDDGDFSSDELRQHVSLG